MHIDSLDLNLIAVLEAMFRDKSVTCAAHGLGLTQSAMSHSLNRLRLYFEDPLFVKSGNLMAPTPKAESLRHAVLEVMAVVPAQWVRFVRPGQSLEVRIDETGSRHSAQIVAIGSQVDPVSQTLNIRARLAPDARLLPGMSGDASLK